MSVSSLAAPATRPHEIAPSEPPATPAPAPQETFAIDYGLEAEAVLAAIQAEIDNAPSLRDQYPPRWLAIQIVERDEDILRRLQASGEGASLLQRADRHIRRLAEVYGDDADIVLTDHRYGWINALVHQVVIRPDEEKVTLSDRLDRVLTHRVLGLPIFLAAMWAVFKLTSDVTAPYLDWISGVVSGPITDWTVALFHFLGLGGTWIESLVVDGVIAGVGGVLVFVPVLMSLYLALAVLEDSGYMARAAFLMDRLMQPLGLHGKSFLPMIVGFGCTVPAIYATRTLENRRDRVLTGLLVPFMSCSARLPVYVLFAAIFFPGRAGLVIFGIYMLGIAAAVLLGLVLKHTLFQGNDGAAFVMELPPYRVPTLRSIWLHMWRRTSSFVHKAWTVIMMMSIIVWALMAIPAGPGRGAFAHTEIDNSLFATAAQAIAPVFAPLGFGSWQASGSLITGFVAKEVIVSTLGQTYGAEIATTVEEAPSQPVNPVQDLVQIGAGFVQATIDTIKSIPLIVGIDLFPHDENPEPSALMSSIQRSFAATSGGHAGLAGLAFMVFVLLYTPCIVAVTAARHEFGARWMWTSVIGQFALAWIVAFLVFQGGLLLGLG